MPVVTEVGGPMGNMLGDLLVNRLGTSTVGSLLLPELGSLVGCDVEPPRSELGRALGLSWRPGSMSL